jgi:hypothetical protein
MFLQIFLQAFIGQLFWLLFQKNGQFFRPSGHPASLGDETKIGMFM